jgi:glycosyltransferase involved in cell wall biosynthesis/peptidoglycan/xylan/chitin deacetylase (PgdA/CDA1 family)
MTKPGFSIVVPTYQRRDTVADAVRAIARIAYDGDLEAIVVVDGSTDGTAELLATLEVPFPFRVIVQANGGASSARNTGAAAARGEVLLFMDDDMMCAADIVVRHAESYAAGADAVLGDIPLDPASPPSLLTAGVAAWVEERSRRLANGAPLGLSDLLTGQLSIRRHVFEAIGGFDGSFTRAGSFGNEDLDIGTRLLGRYRVEFNPRAVSHQRYVVGYRQHMRQWFQAGQADVEFARKHPARAAELFAEHDASSAITRWLFRPLGRIAPLARGLAWMAVLLAQSLWGKWRPLDRLLKRCFFGARSVLYWNGVASRGGMPGNSPLLVLCYHSISDLSKDRVLRDYGIPREQFARQLDALAGCGYVFIRPQELPGYLAGSAGLPRKSVLLTFDDCYAELPEVARMVLQPRGIMALAFAVTAIPSGTNEWDQKIGCTRLDLLTDQGLRDLASHGVEIGCHSRTHPELPTLSEEALGGETLGAALDLEAKGLPRPRFFAYPYGSVETRVARAVKAAGFAAGFGLRAGHVVRSDDPMVLPRVEILRRDTGLRFWLKTRAPRWAARLKL